MITHVNLVRSVEETLPLCTHVLISISFLHFNTLCKYQSKIFVLYQFDNKSSFFLEIHLVITRKYTEISNGNIWLHEENLIIQ